MKRHFPAIYVILPPSCEGRRAAFYLATEEYIAEKLPVGSYFFTWKVGPTVVMGRNQVLHQEVNLDFCRKEAIDVIRRRSGGGAIFADGNNIMTSLITEDAAVEPLFQEYAESVATVLREMGVPTEVSGRNDIVLRDAGKDFKVCGNAFYRKFNRCIVHGTMLYDTEMRQMEGALHPDVYKLESKGVKSVRSRIGLLKDYLPFGIDRLQEQLHQFLCNTTITLGNDDIQKIEELEQRYYQPEYFYGTSNHANIFRRGRIEGVGTLELNICLQDSIISDVSLNGDYFDLGNSEETFKATFINKPFTPESIHDAIRTLHPESTIRRLSEDALLQLLMSRD